MLGRSFSRACRSPGNQCESLCVEWELEKNENGRGFVEMKGLILAGGTRSRLRPLTYTGAKQLLPVGNRPILFYAVDDMVRAGVTDIGVVVGETAPLIEAALGDGTQFECHFTYIPQEAPLGLAHAVKISQLFLGTDPFLMVLGDNLLRGGVAPLVQRFQQQHPAAAVLLTQIEDPRQFGVAVVEAGRVVRLVEKPEHPPSNLALVGAYCFDARIHEAVSSLRPSGRGDLEITDAIQWLVDHNEPVDAAEVTGWWKDTGRPEDVLDANRLILDDLKSQNDGSVDADSQLTGRVAVATGAIIEHSTIRGPATIGEGAVIIDSYIGPYTSIGPRVHLRSVEIELSVVLPDSRLENIGERIDQSLIGQGVDVRGRQGRPKTVRLVLGDHSRIEI